MADVFLSYAREDRAKAAQIAAALAAGGYDVFWDVEIPPGTSWADFLQEKLSSCKTALVLWSHTSTASQWVREEARLARDKQKLIPVMIDDAQPPFGFGEIQAANLTAWNGESDHPQWRLLLEGVARAVGAPPRPPLPAPPPPPVAPPPPSPGWNAPPHAAPDAPGAPAPSHAGNGGAMKWFAGGGVAVLAIALFAALSGTNHSGPGFVGAPSGPGAIGLESGGTPGSAPVALSAAVQRAVDEARAAQAGARTIAETAEQNAQRGQQAAAAAGSGNPNFGVSQTPMGMVAGDLQAVRLGGEGAVGIAMNASQFFGTMQTNGANAYSMFGMVQTGGAMASGRWVYTPPYNMQWAGRAHVPGRYAIESQEIGRTDTATSTGVGVITYPNGEHYEGQYRSAGEGAQVQVFRHGLGAYYAATGALINSGRFENDVFSGP